METTDRTIKCATCGRDFLFTAKEQDFFLNKGFKEPRHCRECRQQRKQERDTAIAQATGQSLVAGKDKFKVSCANCQREAFVPFKPSTGKPVLCKDCFIAQKYGSPPQVPESKVSFDSVSFQAEDADSNDATSQKRAHNVSMNDDSGASELESLIAENTLAETHS